MQIKKFLPLGILFCSLLLIGQGCFGGGGSAAQSDPVTISYWRVFDGEDAFRDIISAYEAQHPNVNIDYRKLRFDEYEDELIRALAEDRGPDIFSVQNTKINEFSTLIDSMPSQVTVSEQQVRGTLQREVVLVNQTKPTLNTRQLKDRFVDQVIDDILVPVQTESGTVEVVAGLPYSVDTLALYYNKDLLNAAGIPTPPKTWTELQTQVTALTSYDAGGEIEQSGVALGTADNIERAVDIASLIMMQAGTQMTDERGRVSFASGQTIDGEKTEPAINALTFYTDFANPVKEAYSWDADMPNSLEAFVNGETAFFFGYSYHAPIIETSAPKLNYAVSHMPQIAGSREVHFANYWIETVASNTDVSDWAWDFLLFATSEEQVPSYLARANKPPALSNLIGSQLDNEFLGVFAEQVLLADSWYKGEDWDRAEVAMLDMIRDFLFVDDVGDLIELAQRKVSQTY